MMTETSPKPARMLDNKRILSCSFGQIICFLQKDEHVIKKASWIGWKYPPKEWIKLNVDGCLVKFNLGLF
jgi:hypothetical protein